MKVKISDLYIFITILFLTLSHCVAYVGTKVESAFEYSGYLLLLGGVLFSYFKTSSKYRKRNTNKVVILLILLMIPGIFLQDLSILRKMTITFTILAIIIVSVMSEQFINNYSKFRVMAYACLIGVVISIILSIMKGVPIIRYTSEPMFGMIYFFNGGIRDKNVATMMIAIIMSLYIYSRESRTPKSIDIIVAFFACIVIFFANSRGAWIELAVFLLMLNIRRIRKITKEHRGIVVLLLILVAIPLIIYFYNNYIMKSETFLFRHRGLTNYITMFNNDIFHIVFGNAELAYGSGQDYAIAVRSVTGWNGTIENSWLNILIKSGILGVVAYIILFVRAIITAVKCNNISVKTIYLSVTITLFVSSFVAIYIQTIHGLFGVYCYLIMAYYSGKIRKNNYYNNTMILNLS